MDSSRSLLRQRDIPSRGTQRTANLPVPDCAWELVRRLAAVRVRDLALVDAREVAKKIARTIVTQDAVESAKAVVQPLAQKRVVPLALEVASLAVLTDAVEHVPADLRMTIDKRG